jgi:hypothetical protein
LKQLFLHLKQRVSAHRGVWVMGAVGLCCAIVTVLLFQPGYMSLDSTVQLEQARSLEFSDHHPILMSLVWRYLDKLVEGPIGMLVLMSALYWGGLSAIIGTLRWPLWLRAPVLPLVGFYPPVFCIVGAIWKDALMQATLLAALGCFLGYIRTRRRALLVVGLLFTAYGLSVRHNGIAAAWPLLALPLLSAKWMARVRVPLRPFVAALIAAVGSAVTLIVLLKALSPFALKANYWQLIASFDLAGISLQTGEMQIDPGSPALSPGIGLREIRRSYSPLNHMTLYNCARRSRAKNCGRVFVRLDDPVELQALSSNWRRAVREHPRAWLAHRYRVYSEVAGLTRRPAKLLYLGPRGVAKNYPLPPRTREMLAWFHSVRGTLWFRVWLYVSFQGLAVFAALAFYVRTGSALPMALCLSGLSYALSLFIAAGAPDYRYSEWTVMTGVLALVTLLQPWKRGKPEKAAEPVTDSAEPASSPEPAGSTKPAATSEPAVGDPQRV